MGVAAMLTPGLFVWAKFVDVPEEAHVVEAVGQQWHWTFRYPGEDGKLGEVDAERISADNPFGIDPEDPNGQDDVIVYNPEAHVPLDKPVKFLLRSKDVLHNFTVAQFRVKMDLVPGMNTFLWLTPTKTGRFELLCEELCGIGHYAMRGAVVVDEAGRLRRWLAQQPTFAEQNARVAGNATIGVCPIRCLRGLPWPARAGHCCDECTEARGSVRLVSEAPDHELQERLRGARTRTISMVSK